VEEFWTGIVAADEVIGPHMLLPECSSNLYTKVYQGLLTYNDAIRLNSQLLALPIRISSAPHQFTRAIELAHKTRRIKTYDMQYVALAEFEQCEVVTLDGGIYQMAIEIGVRARLLR
jgi:predicted nucleic acid-binding protein